jgi:uncharacterized Fe-S radical SAM superfamily protein PflX
MVKVLRECSICNQRCAVDYDKWTDQTFFDDIIWVVKSKNRR